MSGGEDSKLLLVPYRTVLKLYREYGLPRPPSLSTSCLQLGRPRPGSSAPPPAPVAGVRLHLELRIHMQGGVAMILVALPPGRPSRGRLLVPLLSLLLLRARCLGVTNHRAAAHRYM